MILSTPITDTFSPVQLPDTLFNFVDNSHFDADLFFNFDDACIEGPVPKVEEPSPTTLTAHIPAAITEQTMTTQFSDSQISDGSLFGGNENFNDDVFVKHEDEEETKPAQGATINPNALVLTLPETPPPTTMDGFPLALPSIEPAGFKLEHQQDFKQEFKYEATPFADDQHLQALFKELEGPIAEALQLPSIGTPTPVPNEPHCVPTSWSFPTLDVPWPSFDDIGSSGPAQGHNSHPAAALGGSGGGSGGDRPFAPPLRDMFAPQRPCGDRPSSAVGDAREVFDSLDAFGFGNFKKETTFDGLDTFSSAAIKQETPTFDGLDTFSPAAIRQENPSSDGLDAFDFSNIKQEPTDNLFIAPPPPPQPQQVIPKPELDPPFLPDLAHVSAGQVPLTYNEDSVNLLYSLLRLTSLTAPQLIPRSVPAVTPTAAATATTRLAHPKPRSLPRDADFIHHRSLSSAPPDMTPYKNLNRQGIFESTIPVPSSSYITPAQTPLRDPTTPIVNGKVLQRIPKPAKAKDIDVSDWYDPHPEAPAPWGGMDPTKPMFQYNKEGELLPTLRFTREQILYYIRERKQRNLPLTLWIQNVPHGCKRRVGDDRLRACRWSGCPAYKGTILKGFWRVCFDERPDTSGKQHDPYHNAGYMHLWCLDRCFDLFEIAEAFGLKPDTRHFVKEARNPMAMTRDHDELVMEFEEWRTSQETAYMEWQQASEANRRRGAPVQNRQVSKEAKLWYVLTTKHLALETPVRNNMRMKRNGISIDKHKGDLDWYVAKVSEKKLNRRGQYVVDSDDEDANETQASMARPGIDKRKREDYEDDEDDSISQAQRATGNKRFKDSFYSSVERR
ncbi:hypothetical protein CORC01_12735 [Colletotrichum orchidophilum]|uniref:Uncharacterized protein n=1 Tax=Colletotrichum orchidophilum TaxID=1209926 RepID=A0A1G4ARZ9_9PEZI|nr:uncharacterized protein CORC01_12735 [Colletotrichum orchidophilum]OHE91947.1 hypothetical protein CORC01_12735 [Colletotrichum orchidophilum]